MFFLQCPHNYNFQQTKTLRKYVWKLSIFQAKGLCHRVQSRPTTSSWYTRLSEGTRRTRSHSAGLGFPSFWLVRLAQTKVEQQRLVQWKPSKQIKPRPQPCCQWTELFSIFHIGWSAHKEAVQGLVLLLLLVVVVDRRHFIFLKTGRSRKRIGVLHFRILTSFVLLTLERGF